MANSKPVTQKGSTIRSQKETPVRLIYILLLIAYGLLTVFTPKMGALDSNGPKFLALALLNLCTFGFLFTRSDIKSRLGMYFGFLVNPISLAYFLLIILSLISFIKAINVLESVLHFAKIFTAFSAACFIAILIMSEKRGLIYLSLAMSILLVIDCLTVFSAISKYIHEEITSINDIKSVYSNNNILTAAVFVKIPFALWLMLFQTKWMKVLGIVAVLLSISATFFLSARAFYLGLFALTIVLSIYLLMQYKSTDDKFYLRTLLIYFSVLIFLFLLFSATQRYFYPKTKDASSRSVAARVALIKPSGGRARLDGWLWSWHVFKENPLLGVGLGNWKLAVMREENLTYPEYGYRYKAHNDFIEITAETGVFGGFLFLAIFVLVAWRFIHVLFSKESSGLIYWILIPTLGLFCYSFDAFFNFPRTGPRYRRTLPSLWV